MLKNLQNPERIQPCFYWWRVTKEDEGELYYVQNNIVVAKQRHYFSDYWFH